MISTVLYSMCRKKAEGEVVVEGGQQSPESLVAWSGRVLCLQGVEGGSRCPLFAFKEVVN